MGIILIPQNNLDNLWFTFSEEAIRKFQYFFSKIYKKNTHLIPKKDMF